MLGSFFNTHPKPDMTEFLVFPKRNVYKSIYEDVDGKRNEMMGALWTSPAVFFHA